jgi:hypothetical protein
MAAFRQFVAIATGRTSQLRSGRSYFNSFSFSDRRALAFAERPIDAGHWYAASLPHRALSRFEKAVCQ